MLIVSTFKEKCFNNIKYLRKYFVLIIKKLNLLHQKIQDR